METIDGLAFIGRNPLDKDNVYIVTGDSGMGMTHSTIAGILLTDLIMGRDNAWAELYDPSRMPVGAASRFAQENLNVVAQYADWLTAGAVESVEEIAQGRGGSFDGVSQRLQFTEMNKALHTSARRSVRTWDASLTGTRRR